MPNFAHVIIGNMEAIIPAGSPIAETAVCSCGARYMKTLIGKQLGACPDQCSVCHKPLTYRPVYRPGEEPKATSQDEKAVPKES